VTRTHRVRPVVYAAVIVLNGVCIGGNRVRAVHPASDYLTDLALEIPVVPVTVVRLPFLGAHSADGERHIRCGGCGSHG